MHSWISLRSVFQCTSHVRRLRLIQVCLGNVSLWNCFEFEKKKPNHILIWLSCTMNTHLVKFSVITAWWVHTGAARVSWLMLLQKRVNIHQQRSKRSHFADTLKASSGFVVMYSSRCSVNAYRSEQIKQCLILNIWIKAEDQKWFPRPVIKNVCCMWPQF